MSQGAASPGTTKRVYPTNDCGTKYMDAFAGEGYFKMLDVLLKNKVIDDLKIFFESNVQPGIASWVKGPSTYCEVIPEIRFVEEYIEEDTIIFVRGGFKHWHDLLLKYKNKNWLLLYGANTGRERWTWWDIIFDDILCKNEIDRHGRYWFPFIKPINEEMFFPEDTIRQQPIPQWDFCIGASHIHDRKGQWRIFNAILEYNKKYGELHTIMPGGPRRGLKTLEMIKNLPNAKYVETPGHVHRTELQRIFNDSKYFIHFGAHGQNDRGPIEALACGTPVVIGSPSYHAPFLSDICYTGCNINDPVSIAESLKILLERWTIEEKSKTYWKYKKKSGFNEIIIPRMIMLFSLIKHMKPTIKAKQLIMEEVMNHAIS
jgi:hypothetical protein